MKQWRYVLWWWWDQLDPLSANHTKWSNALKQIVGKLPTNLNCLSVFDHFVELALKRLIFTPLTCDLLIFHLEYFCTVKLLTNELFKNELRAFFLEHWEITQKYGTVECMELTELVYDLNSPFTTALNLLGSHFGENHHCSWRKPSLQLGALLESGNLK